MRIKRDAQDDLLLPLYHSIIEGRYGAMMKYWDIFCRVAFAWFVSRLDTGVQNLCLSIDVEQLFDDITTGVRYMEVCDVINLLTHPDSLTFLYKYEAAVLYVTTGKEDLLILGTPEVLGERWEYVWSRSNGSVEMYLGGLSLKFTKESDVSVLGFIRPNSSREKNKGWFLLDGEELEAYVEKFYSFEVGEATIAFQQNLS
ncbi:uncharacterized protein RAG0_15303 [Rhynchosporium agropyri]|uniref:Uncharacterized protein n=1 Tax=Rhynchosporium agropyri TaxID=914238 RepID=A0A1E1LKG9_9HELO|nr:uncharacterized protein RAG0_15303 [Rhynchosporium agropyri]